MTAQEAARAVAILNACFIDTALEPESVAIWVDEIARLRDPAAAEEAARLIGRSGERFPTMRQFRECYRGVADRMAPTRPELEGVTSGPRTVPPAVKAWLEEQGAGDWGGVLRDL